jgi:hypothetical protein
MPEPTLTPSRPVADCECLGWPHQNGCGQPAARLWWFLPCHVYRPEPGFIYLCWGCLNYWRGHCRLTPARLDPLTRVPRGKV